MGKSLENPGLLNNQQTGKSNRNYGIDLLRIFSMIMVVALHVFGNGIVQNVQHFTLKGEIFWGIEFVCCCAVNCYALISGYVGLNAKHKYISLISLCLQLVFYSLLITGAEIVIAYINGTTISLETIISHLFPSIKDYWYFSAYFCLFFFMPIFNYIVQNIQKNILKKIGIAVLIIFCGVNLITENVAGMNNGYSFLWLAILYIIGAYLAKYKTLEKLSIKNSFLAYGICVGITILSKIVIYILTGFFLEKGIVVGVLAKYNSPTMLLAAVFLLSAFSKMKIGEGFSKVISFISPLAFGVYLIHCHPYIFGLMNGAFAWIANAPIYLGVVYILASVLGIFIACIILDWLRSLLFNLLKIKQFAAWIERVIGIFIGWVCGLLHISLNDEKEDDAKEENVE